MKDMMKKATGEDDGDMKKHAKLKVLKELKSMASGMMGNDLKDGMAKKVTVAAPDNEGLKEGLETAKHIVSSKDMNEAGDEKFDDANPNEDLQESDTEERMENAHASPEDIDRQISELQLLKRKKLAGHSDRGPGSDYT